MNKNLFLLTASLISFTCSPLNGIPTTHKRTEIYEQKTVGKIDILLQLKEVDQVFNVKTVLNRLDTKLGDQFSQNTFDGDLKTLSEEYDRIEPAFETHENQLYITIKVWPRPTIQEIVWNGNSSLKSKALLKELGIKPGNIFNRTAFNKAFHKVKEYYLKKGYFESILTYDLIPDNQTGKVKVIVDVKEGRAGIIDAIRFDGFTSEERSALLKMIYTRQHNFFTSWLTGSGIFNEEAIEQDRLTIINFLQNEGYADSKVEIKISESKKPGKVIVNLVASKGELFRFGKVTFHGNQTFSDAQLERTFIARPDKIYSTDALRDTVQAIKDLYGRKGLIEANVQYETHINANSPIYDVHFQIEEGEEYRIGLIRVFGNVQTITSVILRESLLVPGEIFDSAKIDATRRRLENIGYFKRVDVYTVRTQDEQLLGSNHRDVYIEVDESTTGNMSLFFGYSSSDSLFGGLDISESNFNYKGFSRLFKDGPSALRGGGEYAHAKITLGSSSRNYTISWLTPYFRDTLWKVGFETFINQNHKTSKRYDVDSFGGSLYASYPLNAYWSLGTKYRFKHSKIDISSNAPEQEKKLENGSGVVSAASLSLNFDSTDSLNKPRNGFRSSLESEYAGLGGRFSFLKYSYTNTLYQSLWKYGIMKYRFDMRFIQPTFWTKNPWDIPLSERFFLGGESSLRGFSAFDVGQHFTNGDPIGGTSTSVASIEYLQEIFPVLDLFAFIDAGSLRLQNFTISNIRMSWGLGIRLEVMNRVPITIGWGFPVNSGKDEKIDRFFFSMGGQF